MATKQKVADKVFVTTTGDDVSRGVPENVDHLEFRFVDGTVVSVDKSVFSDAILDAAMWHGLKQKLGDVYAGAKSVADAIAAVQETIDDLKEGSWITQAEGGGPRQSQLSLAYARAMRDAGHEITDEDAAAKVAEWSKEKRKDAADMPAIAAHLATIKLEQAQKRADELRAKAAESGADGDVSAL